MEKHYCDRCEQEITIDSCPVRVDVEMLHPRPPGEVDMVLEYCYSCWPNIKLALLKKIKQSDILNSM
jgi:hypothetical protein